MKKQRYQFVLGVLAVCAVFRCGPTTQAQSANLIVDLDASKMTDATSWQNAGTLGNFTPLGSPVLETVAGLKAVTFAGNGDSFQGPVSIPELEGNHARSIEVWAYNPSIASEETLVAWGHRGGPNGSNMSFNYGNNSSYGAVGQWGTDVGWSSIPVAGQWHYLVYTFDGTTVKVYDNGKLANQRAMALSTHPGNPVLIAAQNDNNGQPQTALSGTLSIAKVRIRSTALTQGQINTNFLQDAGVLQTLNIQAVSSMVIAGSQLVSLDASYANVANLKVTDISAIAYSSSDTNIITVSTNGQVKAVGLGSAKLVAKYASLQTEKDITVTGGIPAVLKHRYNFGEAAGSVVAKDLIGTSDGQVIGGASFAGDGQITMDGVDGYVDLPNGMISSLTNATFEAWATWSGSRDWERIFDFGTSDLGEDQQGSGTTYLFLTPRNGGTAKARFATTITGGGAGEEILDAPTVMPNGKETHYAVVYSYATQTEKLFVNGLLVATRALDIPLQSISDVNNWLGRSQWRDPYFNGQINEFRIYDGALTDFEVAVSMASGPDTPQTQAGELQTVSLALETNIAFNGISQATPLGNYANVSNLNLKGMTGVVYQSSNTNIATVSATGLVRGISEGSAIITLSYQGKQDTRIVTVAQAPRVLIHRYSFDETTGSTTAQDSVGGASGTLSGGAAFDGAGQLVLDGVDGYVNLPNGLISSLNNVTFDTWVTWNNSANFWERIFDFGNSNNGEDQQGNGTSFLFVSPKGGDSVLRFEISNGGGGQPVNGKSALQVGQETHVTLVYNYSSQTVKLYVNGSLAGSGATEIPLSAVQDVNNWLGRSQFSADRYFNGQLNEFRIYDGALTDFEVALSDAGGVANTFLALPGNVKKLTAQVSTNSVLLGSILPVTVFADFDNINHVNVTTLSDTTYQSSDTNVISIAANGQMSAYAIGSATITANYKTQQATVTVAVVQETGIPVKPILIHRYSFGDSDGSQSVKDSVGSADGKVIGGAPKFANGELTLNDSFVLLPDGIISAQTNITVETWATWSAAGDWQRLFDFGSTLGTPGVGAAGVTWFGISPRRGDSQRVGFAAISPDLGETRIDAPSAMPTGQQTHVALSYNTVANVAQLYVNGINVGTGPAIHPLANLNDTNNCIGASEWTWDAKFNGRFNEFRIYSGAMTDPDVAASYAAGPDYMPGQTAPKLQVIRSGASVVISWPVSAAGFALQSTATPAVPTSWQTVGTAPTVDGNQNKVTVTPSAAAQFYRLKK